MPIPKIILPENVRALTPRVRQYIMGMTPNNMAYGKDLTELYLSAIQSNDKYALQKLRDLHYLSKFPNTVMRDGNTPIPLYSGTIAGGYTEYNPKKSYYTTVGHSMFHKAISQNNRMFLTPDIKLAVPFCFREGPSEAPHVNTPSYSFLQKIGLKDKPYILPETVIPKSLRLDSKIGWNKYLQSEYDRYDITKRQKRFPMVYPLYANITRPLTTNFMGFPWSFFGTTEGFANKAWSKGKDGAIIKNVNEWGTIGTDVVIFKPNQVKLTYPVLLDSNGNLIDLNKRDTSKSDMRYYNGGKLKNPTR